MIDIHCHLLPGIDDGPDTVADAVELCRAAAAEGTTEMIATCHQRMEPWWNDDVAHLTHLHRELTAALEADPEPTPAIHLGAEVRIGPGLLDDLDAWPHGPVLSLAGGRWLLLEPSRSQPIPRFESLIHELVVAGWRPILAHPEDIAWLGDDVDRLAGLVERGAHLQITAGSLTGDRGRARLGRVHALLDAGLVAFVASDAHNTTSRPPGLAAAHRVIERLWGATAADLLTRHHPAAVLEDLPLDASQDAGSPTEGRSTTSARSGPSAPSANGDTSLAETLQS